MSEIEFVEFTMHPKGELVSINIFLEEDKMALFKDMWRRVKGCQPPLVDAQPHGLHVHIPWILEGQDE